MIQLRDPGCPTRQRIALLTLLIATNRHYFTAEILYAEASKARCHVSRATVCSASRQFEQVGLVKRISVLKSRKAWFALNLDFARYSRF
jgi:Fur family iron response transcriptional regulator